MSQQTHHLNVFAKLRIGLGALILGVLLAMAGPVQPAAASCGGTTIVGTETALNSAIAAFNAETTTPCPVTIQLTANIDLTASTTVINNAIAGVELVIEGGGFAVDGKGAAGVRPFEVAANTTVTMNDLTIRNGSVTNTRGGGISNDGALTINDSSILENEAQGSPGSGGGIYNDGTLTVARTIIDGNSADDTGGGIDNRGNLTVIDSTISGNSAATQGAGIYSNTSASPVDVSNTTVSGNSADTRGGGIYNTGNQMTVRNSTISGNTAGLTGGGVENTFNLTLDSVTITGNTAGNDGGGALYNSGSSAQTTVRNSILANSVNTDDCFKASGTITDGGHNLVETQSTGPTNSCGFADGVNDTIVGQDPNLGPLANNGGPTQTHALLTGSPAIDAGDTALTDDQRGVTRPKGAADDIGAFERASLRFTIEGPGVQQSLSCSAAEGLVEETFDNLSGSGVGTLSGALGDYVASGNFLTVFGQDEFGGAEVPSATSNYLELETGGGGEISAELDFAATGGPGPVGYFGFWWSAGDGNNRLEVTRADGSVETFTTQSIINSPALQGSPNGNGVGVVDGHFGNPTINNPPDVNGQNSGEAYAFVNIYALDEASKITSVRFITSGSGFESDNHTICTELIDTQTGTDVGGITIRKETNSSSDTTTEFEFSQTIEADNGGSFPNFTLTKDGEQTFSNVTPGAYTVTEVSIPSPYTLDDITCIDPDGDNSSGDVGTATAMIDLSPNEAVICTFTNNDPTVPVTLGWFLAEARRRNSRLPLADGHRDGQCRLQPLRRRA